jgi:hypothetical protein
MGKRNRKEKKEGGVTARIEKSSQHIDQRYI